MLSKRELILIKIIYIAIFSALCFVGTSINIPIGASKVHLGNFFCILAGLLCGGLVGGIAGSLGMGLNDIVFGYPYTSYLRTFIIKFLMGFIVGSLFRLLLKKPLRKEIYVSILILLGLILYAYALYIFINSNVEYKNIIFIFSSILFALIIIITILIFKIKNVTRCLLLSLLASIFVNVIGEFFMRILFLKLAGQTYNAALISSFSKLPGALLTSIITILLVAILFYPLYKATYKINKLNDLNQYFKN